MIIRKYRPEDRTAIENINIDTWLFGKSVRKYIDNRKLFVSDIAYYFEKEPESIFVAEENGKVIGYLLGCLDDKNNDEVKEFILRITKIIFLFPFMSRKDRKHYAGLIKFVFKMLTNKIEIRTPPNAGHIHINLIPQARGKGIGTKLLNKFLKYAKSKGVKTIHADSWDSRLNNNKNFWLKNGFKEYSRAKLDLFKTYYPKEEIYSVCYLKKL